MAARLAHDLAHGSEAQKQFIRTFIVRNADNRLTAAQTVEAAS